MESTTSFTNFTLQDQELKKFFCSQLPQNYKFHVKIHVIAEDTKEIIRLKSGSLGNHQSDITYNDIE